MLPLLYGGFFLFCFYHYLAFQKTLVDGSENGIFCFCRNTRTETNIFIIKEEPGFPGAQWIVGTFKVECGGAVFSIGHTSDEISKSLFSDLIPVRMNRFLNNGCSGDL